MFNNGEESGEEEMVAADGTGNAFTPEDFDEEAERRAAATAVLILRFFPVGLALVTTGESVVTLDNANARRIERVFTDILERR